MSLWCVAGAPLLAGTDLVHPSNVTLQILANQEVTAINQDLGLQGQIQGTIVAQQQQRWWWWKPFSGRFHTRHLPRIRHSQPIRRRLRPS